MTRYDTGNPLWYCFLFPIFPMVLLLGLWCYFGWMHEKLVRCGATKESGLHKSQPFWLSKTQHVTCSMSLIRVDSHSKVRLSQKTNVKSMISTPKSPSHIKFRMRTSNDIEEGSYVSYCKLDGGMFSFVVFQAKCLLLCPQMISESF